MQLIDPVSPWATHLNLGNLISAISLAFDIAEQSQLNHARRTGYIAYRLGASIGLPDEALLRTLYAALMHDIGATENFNELVEDHDGRLAAVFNHPIRGREVVGRIPHLHEVGTIIQYHHERWDGTGYPFGLRGEEIPVEARLIYLADRMDLALTLATPGGKEAVAADLLETRGGKCFQPELVQAAKGLVLTPRFWLDLDGRNTGRVIDGLVKKHSQEILCREVGAIGEVFADLIDNRSSFTAKHSREVATIAVKLARHLGFGRDAEAFHVAGLLHDLGKIGVPGAILNKPGRLTAEEFRIIQAHPYYTEQILSEVDGLGDIVAWAAQHHERLDGTGYHSGSPADEIAFPGRIIAVADFYQAVTANRPYRAALSHEDAVQLLDKAVADRHLDGDVVQALKECAA